MSAEMDVTVDMVSIEVDGIPMQAPKGSMIIEATDKAGIDIPRFESKFQTDFKHQLGKILQTMRTQGLINLTENRCSLTPSSASRP